LRESVYEECLGYELSQPGLSFKPQVQLPVSYRGVRLACGYKIDLVVADTVILEIKSVDQVRPVHTAQLLTYLKRSGEKLGLLLNFNAAILAKGIKRLVNHFPEPESTIVPSAPSALSGFDFPNSASQRLCGEETVVN
jgi:GxxExxY protein